jgi:pimeloyl-ACP methyl ester carboxylesterase
MRIAFSLVLVLTCTCNVVHMQRNRLLKDFDQWGLFERNVELGDDTVRFYAGGRGRELLLLHGFGASAIWQWHGQRYLTGAGFRVMIPDLLWFGGSSSTRRDFSLDHQVDMVIALLDKIGWEQGDVVGVSYGGVIAYELARRKPELVRRLVMVDSPGPIYTEKDRAALFERLGTDDLTEVLIPTDAADVERLMNIAYYDPPWSPEFAAEQVIEEMYGEYREEKKELLRAAMDRIGKEEPEPLNLASLVVWGREDPFFPLELGERLAEFLGAQLLVIPEAKHGPNMEHHELFNEKVAEFLR